jgi:hypothetical protein
MTRTDIHRPSAPEFDPEAYDCVGVFDLHPEEGDNRARAEEVNRQLALGNTFRGAPHGTGQCGHCGAHIRYAALMVHTATKTLLYVGEQCLTNRFEALTKAQFRQLREDARLNREKRTRQERIDAFIAVHPEAKAILDYEGDNTFVGDIQYKLRRYTELSDRQVEAAVRAIARDAEHAARQVARASQEEALRESGVSCPTGRATVTGEVIAVKWVAGFGYNAPDTKKLVVKSDEGWKVYVTAASSIYDADKGTRVRFTCNVTPSDDDPLFGFGKRPTKAEIL